MTQAPTSPTAPQLELRPQDGPQTVFLSTSADIAVYGGAAGGGKTFALLLEGVRHTNNPDYGFVIFRRTSPEIRNEGGLWDESGKIYPHCGARPLISAYEWKFPAGSKCKFSHMQYEQDMYSWQGSQVPYIGFDELTHFTEKQFFYMLSRNRSTCGVRPYVRATANPLATSWVKRFLAPWVDDTYPDPAESGEVRWFTREDGVIRWHDDDGQRITRLYRGPAGEVPKSVTFVRSTIYDNKILMEKDPGYLANLMALPFVERRRLLYGDWNIVASAGNIFRRDWFHEVDAPPYELTRVIRWWDLAATPQTTNKSGALSDPDWTVGALVGQDGINRTYILDIQRFRKSPGEVELEIKKIADLDGQGVEIWLEQEPGSSGVSVIDRYVTSVLRGYNVHGERSTGDKVSLAKPLSAQAEHGSVFFIPGYWNEGFFVECESFPEGDHDDQVDAVSKAFNKLSGAPGSFADTEMAVGKFARTGSRELDDFMKRRPENNGFGGYVKPRGRLNF